MLAVEVHSKPLDGGTLRPAGYKHAAVPILCLGAVLDRRVCVDNVPDVEDLRVLRAMIGELDGHCEITGRRMHVGGRALRKTELPAALAGRIHGSLYLVPPLLGATGQVSFAETGGCRIGGGPGGARPVAHILAVLERFGASFSVDGQRTTGRCRGYRACDIDIMEFSDRKDVMTGPYVSGATKAAVLAAVLVDEGTTRIRNPYFKSDVTELVAFLAHIGIGAFWEGKDIVIEGRARARSGSPDPHCIAADVSEVMTHVAGAAYNGYAVRLEGVPCDRLRQGLAAELALLADMGIELTLGSDSIEVTPPAAVRSVDVEVISASIHSDHQPLIALLLTRGSRAATIRESVWRGRFQYAHGLRALGARMDMDDVQLTVHPSRLDRHDVEVHAQDVRAAAVLLLAALGTGGRTVIRGVEHLARGYEDLPGALVRLGADIRPHVPSALDAPVLEAVS